MSGEAKITRSFALSGGGITIGGATESISVDNPNGFSKVIPKNTENCVVNKPAVDISDVKAMGIVANKNCTVKTNSTSDPDDTLELLANVPLIWTENDPDANKFLSADVATWYVTTGSEDTLLKILAGHDATPGI